MICEKYSELNPIERVVLIGKIVHAIQSDNEVFDTAAGLIVFAETKGVFNGVTILPDETEIQTQTSSATDNV